MSGSKTFLDTNILVYAHDTSAREKHEAARDLVTGLWETGTGLLSTQVLQEFLVTVVRKIPRPMSLAAAKDIISSLLAWEVVVNDGPAILRAADLMARYRFSFWDALIVQSAVDGGASTICSEDLTHGQTVHGVVIMNPFG
jgi:predicted nucleic acid-binding protein